MFKDRPSPHHYGKPDNNSGVNSGHLHQAHHSSNNFDQHGRAQQAQPTAHSMTPRSHGTPKGGQTPVTPGRLTPQECLKFQQI